MITASEGFDAVCALEVVEHVDRPAAFLETCAALVKVDSCPPIKFKCQFADASNLQPGGHLFLSTISRTPLAYFLTIGLAEHALRLVTPGTHTYSKYILPSELLNFFHSRGWISRLHGHDALPLDILGGLSRTPERKEAEVRGLMYIPWDGSWRLAGREESAWGAASVNYIFWVRKPVNVE